MKNRLVLGVFALLCALQIAIPSSMIIKRQVALRHGEAYKFKTAPVDPYDAFRGRYVALNYEQSTVTGSWSPDEYRRGRVAYAVLERDEEGFAKIVDVVLDRPADDQPYLTVRIAWANSDRMTLRLPFDRFYMDEFKAPEVERQFVWRRDREDRNAYAMTRVHRGFGLIEDLMVEDKPILEWLASRAEDAK